jgi:serine/threonine protein kinase
VKDDGVVLGTPRYMAPEQALGQTVDGRADLHAAGLILYELLSGTHAVPGDTPVQVMANVVSGRHTPLAERAPGVPRALCAVVERALARDPRDRFETAEDMIEALLPFVDEDRVPSLIPQRAASMFEVVPLRRPRPSSRPEGGADDGAGVAPPVRLEIPEYVSGPTVSLLSDPRIPRPASLPRVSGVPDWSPVGMALTASERAMRGASTILSLRRLSRPRRTALLAAAAGLGLGTALAWLSGTML